MDDQYDDGQGLNNDNYNDGPLNFQDNLSAHSIDLNYYSNYYPYNSQDPPIQQQPTRQQAYKTVAETKYDPKNIPKTIGNYLRRKILEIEKQGPQFDSKIPIKLKIFKAKKSKGKQADYGIKDFRDMLSDEAAAKFCRQFFEDQIFLEYLYSNRIDDPMKQIAFIEQYIRGTKDPEFLISNRTSEHLKQPQKQKNS